MKGVIVRRIKRWWNGLDSIDRESITFMLVFLGILFLICALLIALIALTPNHEREMCLSEYANTPYRDVPIRCLRYFLN